MLDQYGQLSTAIPAGSKLLGISIKNGVARPICLVSSESGGGSASAGYRLGQVVYTLTQFSTVRAVLFQVEGRTVTTFGPEGIQLDGPQSRKDFNALLPSIFVDRPAFGAAASNPARVTGNSNVFEATFRVAMLDASRKVLVDQMAMATCGSGCRGTFDVPAVRRPEGAVGDAAGVFRVGRRRQSRGHPRLSGLADPELDQKKKRGFWGRAFAGLGAGAPVADWGGAGRPAGLLLSSAGSVNEHFRSGRGAAW